MRRIVPLLSLLFVLTACTSPPQAAAGSASLDSVPADAQTLESHGWRLASATDAGGGSIAALFPDPAAPLRIAFADGRVAVSGGCNRLSATYTLERGTLEVGPVAQTKMFCGGGALMAADEAIATRLRGRLSATTRDGRLLLETATGDRLLLDADPGAATP